MLFRNWTARAALIAGLAISAAALASAAATAEDEPTVTLTPADPQPDESALKPGLAVWYKGADIRTLQEAEDWLANDPSPGEPIAGFTYEDTAGPALTSSSKVYIIAGIRGFMKFPEPGSYYLEVLSNDGFNLNLGGQEEILRIDGRQACGEKVEYVTVEVPQAGWYALDAVWFQRRNTSCLLLYWEKPGDPPLDNTTPPIPAEYYAHLPGDDSY
jgi:hypothetical protein